MDVDDEFRAAIASLEAPDSGVAFWDDLHCLLVEDASRSTAVRVPR